MQSSPEQNNLANMRQYRTEYAEGEKERPHNGSGNISGEPDRKRSEHRVIRITVDSKKNQQNQQKVRLYMQSRYSHSVRKAARPQQRDQQQNYCKP